MLVPRSLLRLYAILTVACSNSNTLLQGSNSRFRGPRPHRGYYRLLFAAWRTAHGAGFECCNNLRFHVFIASRFNLHYNVLLSSRWEHSPVWSEAGPAVWFCIFMLNPCMSESIVGGLLSLAHWSTWVVFFCLVRSRERSIDQIMAPGQSRKELLTHKAPFHSIFFLAWRVPLSVSLLIYSATSSSSVSSGLQRRMTSADDGW